MSFSWLTFLVRRLRGDNHEREMELLDVLCDRARIGIDVGAKVGMYTYRIREHAAAVIAFEPNPALARYLAAVFGDRRARIEGVAVSDRDGHATLRLPHAAPGRATIETANELRHAYVELEVATRTIDGYGLDGVGFIKIDVEGHELAVLAGAERTIVAQRPNLLVEANDEHHPDAVAGLGRWLGERDYDGWFVDGRGLYAIGAYDRAQHWEGRGVENFICVHRSRGDVREALVARVARRRLGRHRADRTYQRLRSRA